MADPDQDIIRGTADVLADLGSATSPQFRTKAALVDQIRLALRENGLTQTQGARVIGINKSEMSRLLNGKFHLFSVDRLMRALVTLDVEVAITVRRRGSSTGETIEIV